jgi:hypothetical protein
VSRENRPSCAACRTTRSTSYTNKRETGALLTNSYRLAQPPNVNWHFTKTGRWATKLTEKLKNEIKRNLVNTEYSTDSSFLKDLNRSPSSHHILPHPRYLWRCPTARAASSQQGALCSLGLTRLTTQWSGTLCLTGRWRELLVCADGWQICHQEDHCDHSR